MDAETADRALGELVAHRAHGRSLLAWTMTWCPEGDPNWQVIWETTRDAKALLNVLVAVGAVRGASLRAGAPYVVGTPTRDAVVELVIAKIDGEELVRSVSIDELAAAVRAEIPRPGLRHVVEIAHPPR